MALIKNASNTTHIMRDYKVPHIETRAEALLWIAKVSKNQNICVKHIDLDDFKSFHDGTSSDQILQITEVNMFVDTYKNSPIKCVSIVGEYLSKPFVLSISLDSGVIGLSCRKSKMVDYQSFEQLLKLV